MSSQYYRFRWFPFRSTTVERAHVMAGHKYVSTTERYQVSHLEDFKGNNSGSITPRGNPTNGVKLEITNCDLQFFPIFLYPKR